MKPATAEITIARPLAEVKDVLDDITEHERFLDHFLFDWKQITRSKRGVGAGVRVRAKGAGRHDKIVVRVIKCTSRRLVEESKGGKNFRRRTRGTYELRERRDGSTKVSFKLEFLEGGLVDRWAWPVGRRKLQRGTQEGLKRLKDQLEG